MVLVLPNGKTIRWNNNGYTYIGNSNNQLSQLANYSDFQEVKTSVSNGKSAIASAITDKGVSTASNATFQTMANNVRNIAQGVTSAMSFAYDVSDIVSTTDTSTTAWSKYSITFSYIKNSIIQTMSGYVDRLLRVGFIIWARYDLSYEGIRSGGASPINLNGGQYPVLGSINILFLNNGDILRLTSDAINPVYLNGLA